MKKLMFGIAVALMGIGLSSFSFANEEACESQWGDLYNANECLVSYNAPIETAAEWCDYNQILHDLLDCLKNK